MKFCIPIPCFFGNMDFSDAIITVNKLGFDTVETYRWDKLDLDKVKHTLDDNGITLLSMCTSEFSMTDPDKRKIWLQGLQDSCITANKLGVKN